MNKLHKSTIECRCDMGCPNDAENGMCNCECHNSPKKGIKRFAFKTAYVDMLIDGIPIKAGERYAFMEPYKQDGDGLYEVTASSEDWSEKLEELKPWEKC